MNLPSLPSLPSNPLGKPPDNPLRSMLIGGSGNGRTRYNRAPRLPFRRLISQASPTGQARQQRQAPVVVVQGQPRQGRTVQVAQAIAPAVNARRQQSAPQPVPQPVSVRHQAQQYQQAVQQTVRQQAAAAQQATGRSPGSPQPAPQTRHLQAMDPARAAEPEQDMGPVEDEPGRVAEREHESAGIRAAREAMQRITGRQIRQRHDRETREALERVRNMHGGVEAVEWAEAARNETALGGQGRAPMPRGANDPDRATRSQDIEAIRRALDPTERDHGK